jgi:hypothetical protein
MPRQIKVEQGVGDAWAIRGPVRAACEKAVVGMNRKNVLTKSNFDQRNA